MHTSPCCVIFGKQFHMSHRCCEQLGTWMRQSCTRCHYAVDFLMTSASVPLSTCSFGVHSQCGKPCRPRQRTKRYLILLDSIVEPIHRVQLFLRQLWTMNGKIVESQTRIAQQTLQYRLSFNTMRFRKEWISEASVFVRAMQCMDCKCLSVS